MKVWKNDVIEWVIAESPEDAEVVLSETYRKNGDYGYVSEEPHDWVECPMDKEFTLADGADEVTKTFAEWIAELGRGFLGTTEY